MCSIILRVAAAGVFIGANRDEMVSRPWEKPGAYWPELPGVVAGRDVLAGGTWLGVNAAGVMAAVLNRHGSLGPAAGKNSRGELPLIALAETSAAAGAEKIAALDAGLYRSFNVVVADAKAAFFLAGLEGGRPEMKALAEGVWMVTSGEPNDFLLPRIARHLPRFTAAAWADWPALLADAGDDWETALNIPERAGFGTVCSSVIALPAAGPVVWKFAAGAPDAAEFENVKMGDQRQC